MKIFLKILFGIVIVITILVIGLGVAGYFFFTNDSFRENVMSKISISDIFMSSEPKDLGIKYSDTDVTNVYSRTGTITEIQEVVGDDVVDPSKSVIADGSKAVDVELTSEEATALLNEWAEVWVYAPVTNVQYRINDDNTGEVSALFSVEKAVSYAQATGVPEYIITAVTDYIKPLGDQFPVYLKGTLEIENGNVDLNLSNVKVGFISVPSSLYSGLKGETDQFVEDRLTGGMVSERIDTFKMEDGKAIVKGNIPEKVTYVK